MSAGEGDAGAGATRHQDPLAADRRVLVIGLVAMVAFVAVGVVSASWFTASACRDVGAMAPVPPGAAGDAGTVLAATLGQHAGEAEAALETIAERLGPLVWIADVGDAGVLTRLDGGVVGALGSRTTLLGGDGEVLAAANAPPPVAVVGDGASLYALVLINPMTGQVDAVAALDGELRPGTCVDTAVVGSPFAFQLGAGRGELLLLRVEEDARDPLLELRDAERGRVWASSVTVPVAPPGILAERVTAVLGDELVVVGRRVIPGEEAPALAAFARGDGASTWGTAPGDLDRAPVPDTSPDAGEGAFGDGIGWVRPLTISDDAVVALVSPEDRRTAGRLVAVDAVDGRPLWRDGEELRVLDVAERGELLRVAVATATTTELRVVRARDGEARALASVPRPLDAATVATLADGATVLAGGDTLVVTDAGGDAHVDTVGLDIHDVVVGDDGRVTLLLATPVDGVRLAATFAGRG